MPTPARHANSTPAIRGQRFVTAIMKGVGPADAYVHAGYKVKSRAVARASGSRLLARADIQARLTALRERANNESVLSLQQKREYLKKVVVTPVSEVTEADAICGKVSRTTRVTSDGVVERVMVSM